MMAIFELIEGFAAFEGMSYYHYNNQKDGITMKEDTKYQKHFSADGFWTKFKKQAVEASLKVFYSGLIMIALLPTVYGADWPERGWC